jgi:hypothetical protein
MLPQLRLEASKKRQQFNALHDRTKRAGAAVEGALSKAC